MTAASFLPWGFLLLPVFLSPALAQDKAAAPAQSETPWLRVPAQVEQALNSPRLQLLQPHPDDGTKSIEGVSQKLNLRAKYKDCCGYPVGERSQFKMTFYWLAWESEYANEPYVVDIYTRNGFLIGRFPRTFVFELKLEGSAILRDGRALNYDGRCNYGIGVCFQTLDINEHPLGKGGQGRPLVPFRSVAVDPSFVPLGTPLYVPELDGLLLPASLDSPEGARHDGCVRADDTGGNIRRHELDFFVESYANYKFLDDQFLGNNHVTPYIEEPRCAYLHQFDPSVDRHSEATDWARLEVLRLSHPAPTPSKAKPSSGKPSRSKPSRSKPSNSKHKVSSKKGRQTARR
jgi:3D (Asp-Asp-Asp) domain-containing protein